MRELKSRIREQLLAARAAIPADQKAADERVVCSKLLAIIGQGVSSNQGGGFIGLYDAFGSELSLEILIEQLREKGYQLAFPVAFADGSMDFFSEDLEAGGSQLAGSQSAEAQSAGSQPSATQQPGGSGRFDFHTELPAYRKHHRSQTSELTLVRPEQLAFLVIPGVGFDVQDHRLGYGAGYYDRYLPRLSPPTPLWGAAFAEQLLDFLPVEEHDIPLTGVVTPQDTIMSNSKEFDT